MNLNIDNYAEFAGTCYTFPDGIEIKLLQVKQRETGLNALYEITYPGGIPKRHILNLHEFVKQWGHLFEKT